MYLVSTQLAKDFDTIQYSLHTTVDGIYTTIKVSASLCRPVGRGCAGGAYAPPFFMNASIVDEEFCC